MKTNKESAETSNKTLEKAMLLSCPHSEICSVCSWIQTPYSNQRERKLQALKVALSNRNIPVPSEIAFRSPGTEAIRDRVDLTYDQGRYGFYHRELKELFAVESCPVMSPSLFQFFQEVRKIHIPIRRGSIRLRISPSGQRGMWLDLANEDVRDLLQERTTLQAFLHLGFVEIGQRRKKLSSEFKLKDPELHPWTRTWVKGETIDLFSAVGSFSQAGDLANQTLVKELEGFFEKSQSHQWVEFGSGTGNLTFPLAGSNRTVKALEFDALALTGLSKTLEARPQFKSRIEISEGDYQRKSVYPFQAKEGVLVNPPRSGLQKFLDPLFALDSQDRPKDFIYMSCYLESFTEDAARLQELGYEIQELSIVDQFPHTPHFEILSRWSR